MRPQPRVLRSALSTAARSALALTAVCAAAPRAALAQESIGVSSTSAPERAAPTGPKPESQTRFKLDDDRTWTIQIEPSVWFVAPAGRVQMPGGTTEGGQVFVSELNLDSPRPSPYFELHLRRDRWRLGTSGFWLSESDRTARVNEAVQLGTLALLTGDRVKSSLDFWSFEAVAAYRFLDGWPGSLARPTDDPNGTGGLPLALSVDALAGFRVYSVDLAVDRLAGVGGPASNVSDDGLWAEPILGIKADAEIYEQFTVDFQTSFGIQPFTDHDSWSFDIQVDGTWRPWPNVGIQIGYRQLVYRLNDGKANEQFLFRGSAAGLFAGIEIRF